MLLVLCSVGALLASLLAAGPALAAPPANDNFAAAQTITGTNATVSGTNVEATKQAGEPFHADDLGGASVWYVWTAPNSGDYKLDTCGNAPDTLLAVYKGSAVNALTEVASNDEGLHCYTSSELAFHAVSGTTYHFAVDGYSNDGDVPSSTGTFALHLQQATAPANDNFANAQVIPSQTTNYIDGSNVAATKQTGEPNHGGFPGGASVWYSWVAPVTGTMRMDACDSDFFPLFAVYTGNAVNSLTPVAGSGTCGAQFNAVQGTTYRIAVDGSTNNGTQPARIGDFFLRTQSYSPPPNDNFANAQMIFGSSVQVTGTNIDATTEPGETAHFGIPASASVWYSWTAPASGQVTIDTCDSDFDTVLAVYTGNAVNGLTAVAGNDQACGNGDQSRASFAATAGTTYRIVVDGYFGDEGDIDLRLALTVPQLAPKDLTPPQSSIRGVKLDSNDGKATIRFGSSEAGSSFKCKLDHGPFKACHSPKTYRHLDAGKHKVKIAASDAAGNLDTSPAVKSFKIEP